MSELGVSTITDVPGEIACDSLIVGGTGIDTKIDTKIANASSSSNSSDVVIFVGTVLTEKRDLRAHEIQVLPYDHINIDNMNGYDNLTYKYTFQKSGVYMITASASALGSEDFRVDLVYFDGTTNIIIGKMASFYQSRNLSVIYNCVVGDQIYLNFSNTSAFNRLNLDTVSYFTAHSLILT